MKNQESQNALLDMFSTAEFQRLDNSHCKSAEFVKSADINAPWVKGEDNFPVVTREASGDPDVLSGEILPVYAAIVLDNRIFRIIYYESILRER